MVGEDFIEFGESGLVAIEDGWMLDITTGYKVSPTGQVFTDEGEPVLHIDEEEDEYRDEA